MIVWSGWGVLVIVIAVVVGGGLSALLGVGFRAAGLPQLIAAAPFLGLAVAAAVNWVVGRRLNTRPGREMIDTATGRTVILRRRHSLFWIPMEWWSVALGLLAVFLLVAVVSGGSRTEPARVPAHTQG